VVRRPRGKWEVETAAARAAVCALLAGLLWISVWLHQRRTHGLTEVNEMRLLWGLTWMDSGKFLPLSFALTIPTTLFLARRARNAGARTARSAGIVAVASLAGLSVATALDFWPFGWGSYAETFETMGRDAGVAGLFQPLSSLILTTAFLVFAVAQLRVRAVARWLPPMLAAGAFATFFLTPVNLVPAIVWIATGSWLLVEARRLKADIRARG